MGSYLVSVGDLLKRLAVIWALTILGFYAAGLLLYGFVQQLWKEAPVIDELGPWSWWLLLASAILAITIAYHRMRMEVQPGKPPIIITGFWTSLPADSTPEQIAAAEKAAISVGRAEARQTTRRLKQSVQSSQGQTVGETKTEPTNL